ncbi:MAG: SH3 domain-containing protein [Chloroflexales bacterium]
MYERGAVDAARDDLNTFYYQHYYYYRRGYDDARRQQRGGPFARLPAWVLPTLIAVGLALAGIAVLWLLASRSQPELLAPTPTLAPSTVSATALPTAPPSPSPIVIITPTVTPVLRFGGHARVANVGDTLLRARAKPGTALSNPTVVRFPEGAVVVITGGPQQADGLTWWRIKTDVGEGWSADHSAEGLVFLEPLP